MGESSTVSNSDDDGYKSSHVPKHKQLELVELLTAMRSYTDPK